MVRQTGYGNDGDGDARFQIKSQLWSVRLGMETSGNGIMKICPRSHSYGPSDWVWKLRVVAHPADRLESQLWSVRLGMETMT